MHEQFPNTRRGWGRRIAKAIMDPGAWTKDSEGVTRISGFIRILTDIYKKDPDVFDTIRQAIGNLIRFPDEGRQDFEEYWRGLMFVTHSGVPEGKHDAFQEVWKEALWGDTIPERFKWCALYGFLEAGGRLSDKELRNLVRVRELSPYHWLQAALLHGCFRQASDCLHELVRKEATNLDQFRQFLDAARAHWPTQDMFLVLLSSLRQHTERSDIGMMLDRKLSCSFKKERGLLSASN